MSVSISSSQIMRDFTRTIRTSAGGAWLALAAGGFWLAWLLMPGVGVTDANEIMARVGENRGLVMLSVLVQLASAVCYAPALLVLGLRAHAEGRRALVFGATLLLVGAMGSAADAVFHLLAVEMTGPGVDRAAMVPVMARMQGAGLVVVTPLIASFFAGTWILTWGAARAGWISRAAFALATLGPFTAVAASGALPARFAGLAALACIAAAQAWVGLGLSTRPARTVRAGASGRR